ncbi:MAG: hypothetical protein KDE27_01875 [Planctomycetes bacterium]|nr:hypothetical protein [Planctomycetota bacterium]
MKPATAIILATIVIVACLVVLPWRLSQHPDHLLVEKPRWLTNEERADPASADFDVELARVREDPGVITEMTPPEQIAAALEETKQRVEFSATALADSGLAAEVSSEIVDTMELVFKRYQRDVDAGRDDTTRRSHDFLFALWPSMGELIREGTVKPRIVQLPADSRVPRRLVTYLYNATENTLTANINTPNWQVVLHFTEKGNPLPDVYSQIQKTYQQEQNR